MKEALVISCLLLGSLCARAFEPEEYLTIPFSPPEGLSSVSMGPILQDRSGCLWFGTLDGLDRYDGYELRPVPMPEDCDGYGSVRTLCEDDDGNIWIGSFKGICVYGVRSQSIRKYSEGSVSHIVKSRDGALWVAGQYAGFLRIDPATGACDTLRFAYHNASAHYGSGVCYDGRDHVYFLNGVGTLYRAALEDRELEVVLPWTESPFRMLHISRIFWLDGRIIGGTPQKTVIYDLPGRTTRETDWSTVNDLVVKDQVVFMATDTGLYVLDRSLQLQYVWPVDHTEPLALHDSYIRSLCLDSGGGLWLGTNYAGACRLVPNSARIRHVDKDDRGGTALVVSDIVEAPDRTVWIATKNAGLQHYFPAENRLQRVSLPLDTEYLLSLTIDGPYLLVGSHSVNVPLLGLCWETGRVESFPQAPSRACSFLAPGRGHGMLVGYARGVAELDPDTRAATRLEKVRSSVTAMCEDASGRVWMTTSVTGLWSVKDGEWTHYTDSCGISLQLTGLCLDKRSRVWLGTADIGLQCLDPETGAVKTYTRFGGTLCHKVRGIAADPEGTLWVATSQGLAAIDPETGWTALYTDADGLSCGGYGFSEVMTASDGMLYAGNDDGFMRFDPVLFKASSPSGGRIVFTGFSFIPTVDSPEGRAYPFDRPVDSLDRIRLRSDENSFVIQVSDMDYNLPRRTRLTYRLEGYDDAWSPARDGRITITNLRPGKYTLTVRSVGRDGSPTPVSRSLDIHVARPPLASVPAILLYIFLFGVLLAAVIRTAQRRALKKATEAARLENERKEAESQKQLYTSKVEFLMDIAHEIRTPLALVKAPVELLRDKLSRSADKSVVEDLEVVSRNSDKLSQLLDELLDFRRLESSSYRLNLAEHDLCKLVGTVYDRFTLAARSRKMDMTLSLPGHPLTASVDGPALDKVIGNLLSNAVKYASRTIRLSLEEGMETFRIVLENDGDVVPLPDRDRIFRPFERFVSEGSTVTGTGIGLYVSRNLVQLHGGTLEMDDDPSVNRFILTVPVIHVAARPVAPAGVSDLDIPQEKPTVLVVEDDDDMRSFIARQFAPRFNVVTAPDGQRAWDMLRDSVFNVPEAVISDVMMPVMDGFELCRQIKDEVETSHIPVVLLTARADLDSRLQGLEYGADAYLAKPFTAVELLGVVHNLLKNRERLKAKFTSSPVADYTEVVHSSPDARLLQTIDRYITDHLSDEDLSVEELASAACMSVSSLFKKIKHLLGMGPGEYILLVRLKKASQLLQDDAIPISEVSARVGFRSHSYFSNCFKRQFGVTPKAWRNTARTH